MSKSWIQALREWNQTKGNSAWCIPKAGSKEHEQVKAIMKGEPPVQKKKAKKEEVDVANIVAGKRVRKAKTQE